MDIFCRDLLTEESWNAIYISNNISTKAPRMKLEQKHKYFKWVEFLSFFH